MKIFKYILLQIYKKFNFNRNFNMLKWAYQCSMMWRRVFAKRPYGCIFGVASPNLEDNYYSSVYFAGSRRGPLKTFQQKLTACELLSFDIVMAGRLKDFCNPYIYAVKLVNELLSPLIFIFCVQFYPFFKHFKIQRYKFCTFISRFST